MSIPLLFVIGYLLVTSLISVFISRQNKSSKQYFVAAGTLTVPVVTALLFAEIVAGAGTVGNAANAFRSGFSSVWANWGMAIGCVAFAILVLKFFRAMGTRRGVVSAPAAYEVLFDRRSRIVMLINVVVVYIILYSTQASAAASILAPLLGVDRRLVAWCITAVFILITVMGGMKGIARMNIVHTVVMYIGMAIVAFKALSFVGGIDSLKTALPASYFSIAQPDLLTVIAQAVGTAVGFLASANVVSASFSAKSIGTARTGICIAGLIVIPFALMPAIIGLCAKVSMPQIAASDALYSMANSIGSVYSGVVSMAIIAAIWSTAPALLLIVCTTLTKDFYAVMIRPDSTEQQQLRFSRIAAVIIGVAGTAFGLSATSILDQMLGAFQIRSVVGIVLVMAIVWPRVSKDAAFYSMLIGGIVAVIWHFMGSPFGVAPLWPAAAVCLVILVPMTLLSKEKTSPGYLRYQQSLKEMREADDALSLHGRAK